MKTLQVQNLLYYNSDGSRLISNFSLEVNTGDNILLQGSTAQCKVFIELLAGLRSPNRGQIVVCGSNISKLTKTERAVFQCQHIGVAFSDKCFFSELTIMENLCLPHIVSGASYREAEKHIIKIATPIITAETLYRKPQHLSPLQCASASFVRAISCEPELLVLGDLFSALTPNDRNEMWDIIIRLRPKNAALLFLDSRCILNQIMWKETMIL